MFKIIFFLFTLFIISSADIISPLEEIKSFNKEKVALGKQLFFDPNFSKDKTISCASCHSDFGSDKRTVSIGIDGKKGQIQSLSVFNAVNNYKLFWNGRAKNLFEQIDGPVHSDFEMGISEQSIETQLKKTYRDQFRKTYKQEPSYFLFKDAIVAFEKTLITPNSPFDKYLLGENTLNEKEKKGYTLFKNYGCVVCHNGVNIGGNSMQLIGNVIEYPYVKGQADLYKISKKDADKNVFRVPSLRNISKTAPYFHDASTETIEATVTKMAYHNLGMILDPNELDAIVTFLKTLDGDIPTTWDTDVK